MQFLIFTLAVVSPVFAHHIYPRAVTRSFTGAPYPTGPGFDVPPLSEITQSSAPEPTVPLPATFPPGTTPIALGRGAVGLPDLTNFDSSIYPELDKVPPVDSPQVKQWLKELEGHTIPDLAPTKDGTCESDPEFAAQAGPDGRCWWTCGGCVRETDVEGCPDRERWGLTFDDGPSDHTPKLLTYLQSIDTLATFFLVGSRVVSRPDIVQTQLLLNHELSVHTWSHSKPLTSLTTAQVVAELGWTRQAIKDVTGVTPLTFRAPFGDYDDRIRAIAHAMNLTPIIWSRVNAPNGTPLTVDTEDFQVPAGQQSASDSINQFRNTLAIVEGDDNVTSGIISLEHDLFQETVDLAIGETLPNALSRPGPDERGWTLGTVAQCRNIRAGDSYAETTTNATVLALLGRPLSPGTPPDVATGVSTALPTPPNPGVGVGVGPGPRPPPGPPGQPTRATPPGQVSQPTASVQPSASGVRPSADLSVTPPSQQTLTQEQSQPSENSDLQSASSSSPTTTTTTTTTTPSTDTPPVINPVQQPTATPPQPLQAINQPEPQQEIGAPLDVNSNAPSSAASLPGASSRPEQPSTTTTITVGNDGADNGLSFGLRNAALSKASIYHSPVILIFVILTRLV